jgi:hypothetical protein
MCCGCFGDTPDCDKSGCNKLLSACLSTCNWGDKCTGPDGSWGPKLIELVFVLNQGRCCGSRCPNDPPDPPPPPAGALAEAGATHAPAAAAVV